MINRGYNTRVSSFGGAHQTIRLNRENLDYEPAWFPQWANENGSDVLYIGFGTVNGYEARIGGERISGYNPDGTRFKRPSLPMPDTGAIIVKVTNQGDRLMSADIEAADTFDLSKGEYPLILMLARKRFMQVSFFNLRWRRVPARHKQTSDPDESWLWPIANEASWAVELDP
jgi:hypothetical protein